MKMESIYPFIFGIIFCVSCNHLNNTESQIEISFDNNTCYFFVDLEGNIYFAPRVIPIKYKNPKKLSLRDVQEDIISKYQWDKKDSGIVIIAETEEPKSKILQYHDNVTRLEELLKQNGLVDATTGYYTKAEADRIRRANR